jgi:hypothetical protein
MRPGRLQWALIGSLLVAGCGESGSSLCERAVIASLHHPPEYKTLEIIDDEDLGADGSKIFVAYHIVYRYLNGSHSLVVGKKYCLYVNDEQTAEVGNLILDKHGNVSPVPEVF